MSKKKIALKELCNQYLNAYRINDDNAIASLSVEIRTFLIPEFELEIFKLIDERRNEIKQLKDFKKIIHWYQDREDALVEEVQHLHTFVGANLDNNPLLIKWSLNTPYDGMRNCLIQAFTYHRREQTDQEFKKKNDYIRKYAYQLFEYYLAKYANNRKMANRFLKEIIEWATNITIAESGGMAGVLINGPIKEIFDVGFLTKEQRKKMIKNNVKKFTVHQYIIKFEIYKPKYNDIISSNFE